MEYSKAAKIRKKGLLSLIAQKKFAEGQGIGGAIGGAISEKFKARAVGIKEKMDPLSWVSAMAGQGTFGKITTTMLGRAFGRSEDTIKYFGGYARKKAKDKKDPSFTTISSGSTTNLKTGDSEANVLGKMYVFMRKTHEKQKTNYELEVAFREEQLKEDERRHKKLIETLTGKKPTPEKAKEEDEGADSFIKKLMDGIKSALGGILSVVTNLSGLILGIIKNIGQVLAPVLFEMIGGAIGLLTGKILSAIETISKLTVGKFAMGILKQLASLGAGALATMGVGAVMGSIVKAGLIAVGVAGLVSEGASEYRTAKSGEEYESSENEIRAIESSVYDKDATSPEAIEASKQIEQLRKKQIEQNKKYEDDVLTPYFESRGYKLSGREESPPFRAIYKDSNGETPSIIDYGIARVSKNFKSDLEDKKEFYTKKIVDAYEESVTPKLEGLKNLVSTQKTEAEKTSDGVKPTPTAAPVPAETKPVPRVEEPMNQQNSSSGMNSVQLNSTNTVSTGGDTQYADGISVRNTDDSYVVPSVRIQPTF